MRKFKFRLANVLQFRRTVEEDAKNAYLEAQKRRYELEDHLKEISQVRQETLRSSAPDLSSRLALQSWMDHLDFQQHHADVALDILRQEEESAKLIWLERRQEAEALEKLQTRQKEEYQIELTRFEQAELDEWASMRRLST